MKKIIQYLSGGFALFNLFVILPALMSGAPANWIVERIICTIVFGGICFFLGKKNNNKSNQPIRTIYGNKNEGIKSTNTNNKFYENMESREQSSLLSSTTEEIAKKLFNIAANSISEVTSVSGSLDKKGLCEAIIFNSNIVLNDPTLKQKASYNTISDYYLILLYFLIKQQRTDLSRDKLINFINARMEFYSSEYNKLIGGGQYTPIWIYSTFYFNPLADEPKLCTDIMQVMVFQIGLIGMISKTHELLDNLLNKETL